MSDDSSMEIAETNIRKSDIMVMVRIAAPVPLFLQVEPVSAK